MNNGTLRRRNRLFSCPEKKKKSSKSKVLGETIAIGLDVNSLSERGRMQLRELNTNKGIVEGEKIKQV